jgi:hypothetical protein
LRKAREVEHESEEFEVLLCAFAPLREKTLFQILCLHDPNFIDRVAQDRFFNLPSSGDAARGVVGGLL